jgi:glyoxylase-like metal-dependent hydrolase (beta-lactamase superfamily II)
LRLALPFRLDHVNVYLVEDGAGWAVIDTGIDNTATRAAWEALLADPLRDVALTRILVTHYHPDHIGLAGWLCERFGLPLLMSQTEYLVSLAIHLDPGALNAEPYRSFYRSHGLDADHTERLLTNGHRYLRMISGLPRTFRRLIAGEFLPIGSRSFGVFTGGGHAPEQVMLYCRAEKLLLCADQVLAKISPNISVQAMDPQGDPLGIYLRSLGSLERDMPADALVLPGHNLPFVGLHRRIAQLREHQRCTLPRHRGRMPTHPADCCRAGAGDVPPHHRRPAPDGLRLQRSAGACQLHAARGPSRAGLGRRRWRCLCGVNANQRLRAQPSTSRTL